MKAKVITSKNQSLLADAFAAPYTIEEEAEYKKLMIVEDLLQLMKQQSINRTELARRMGVPNSRITAMLNGTNNFTIETLVRAGHAVGAELQQTFVPIKKSTRHNTTHQISKVAESHSTYHTG